MATSVGEVCTEFIYGINSSAGSCFWEHGPCDELVQIDYDLYETTYAANTGQPSCIEIPHCESGMDSTRDNPCVQECDAGFFRPLDEWSMYASVDANGVVECV